jgi:L-fuculose-phosphate aldolase
VSASHWSGLPIGDEEGRILLANHGLITTGTSIEEATYLAVYFERAAALQLAASAAGKIKPVDPDKAHEAGDFLLKTPGSQCDVRISGATSPA